MKKGLSNMITSVLIILLVLVSIAVIWLFIRPFILDSSEDFIGGSTCLQTQLAVIGCTYIGGESNGWYALVTIAHGADENNLSDVTLVFNPQTLSQKVVRWNNRQTGGEVPNGLESSSALFALSNTFPAKVAAGAVLQGSATSCNLNPALKCKKYVYSGGVCPDFDGSGYSDRDDFDLFSNCYRNITDNYNFECPPGHNVDVTHDGVVNNDDYAAYVESFEHGTLDYC